MTAPRRNQLDGRSHRQRCSRGASEEIIDRDIDAPDRTLEKRTIVIGGVRIGDRRDARRISHGSDLLTGGRHLDCDLTAARAEPIATATSPTAAKANEVQDARIVLVGTTG